ncbi:Uncharacterised protein [Vibrio cholerae]|nr:Uncharacterised protein [Vibrio cholerae]
MPYIFATIFIGTLPLRKPSKRRFFAMLRNSAATASSMFAAGTVIFRRRCRPSSVSTVTCIISKPQNWLRVPERHEPTRRVAASLCCARLNTDM